MPLTAEQVQARPDFKALDAESQRQVLARLAETAGQVAEATPTQAQEPPVPFYQEGAGAPGAMPAPATTSTPTSSFADNPPSAVARRAPGGRLVAGLMERTADPTWRLLRTAVGDPVGGQVNLLQTGADLVQVGTLGAGVAGYAPELASALGAGATAQGLLEQGGVNQNTARIIGSVAEAGRLGTSAVQARMAAGRTGRTLIESGEEMGAPITPTRGVPQMGRTEQMGSELQRVTRNTIGDLRKTIGQDVGNAEAAIVSAVPQINPTDKPYADIAREVKLLAKHNITTGDSEGDAALRTLQSQVDQNQPINTATVAKVRRQLIGIEDRPYNYATGDMDNKMLRVFRRELGDAIERVAPNDLAFNYSQARDAYLTNVVKPGRVLRRVMSDNTSPADAYDQFFSLGANQRTFRALHQTLRNADDPGLMDKLRTGFMEKLVGENGNDSRAMLKTFLQHRDTLASTGLFSGDDLQSLEYVIRTKQMPDLINKVSSAVSGKLGLGGRLVGSLAGGEALYHLASSHPVGLLGLAGASMGMMSLRRFLLAPGGSRVAASLAASLVNSASRSAAAIRQSQHSEPAVDDGLSSE